MNENVRKIENFINRRVNNAHELPEGAKDKEFLEGEDSAYSKVLSFMDELPEEKLSWGDIQLIDTCILELVNEERQGIHEWGDGKEFYTEVLRRYEALR